jgi:hypothetical protein
MLGVGVVLLLTKLFRRPWTLMSAKEAAILTHATRRVVESGPAVRCVHRYIDCLHCLPCCAFVRHTRQWIVFVMRRPWTLMSAKEAAILDTRDRVSRWFWSSCTVCTQST